MEGPRATGFVCCGGVSTGDMGEKAGVLGSSPLRHIPWVTKGENYFTSLS